MAARAEHAPLEAVLAPLLASLPTHVEVEIDSPRWSFIKRTDEGLPALISPLPCPFNYGHLPGTTAADGDAIDAIVLGRRRGRGRTGRLAVLGLVDFVDQGVLDTKLVLGPKTEHRRRDGAALATFFFAYERYKRLSATLRSVTLRSNSPHGEEIATRGIYCLTRRDEAWRLSRWPGSRPSL